MKASFEQDIQSTDDIINVDALEKLVLDTASRPDTTHTKQKRLQSRPNTYGSIVSFICYPVMQFINR
jgi:hypothetical protein